MDLDKLYVKYCKLNPSDGLARAFSKLMAKFWLFVSILCMIGAIFMIAAFILLFPLYAADEGNYIWLLLYAPYLLIGALVGAVIHVLSQEG